MRKKELEIMLEKCRGYSNPKVYFEQYVTPTNLAAEIIYFAYMKGDIKGLKVADFGSGTGRLSIGIAMLEADIVFGLEIDKEAIYDAKNNLKLFKQEYDISNVYFLLCDIRKPCIKRVDTVIQNPPFGVHKKGLDIIFLKKALEVADVVYTIHKLETKEYIFRYVNKNNLGYITDYMERTITLPKMYEFHKKERKNVRVIILRIEKS